MRHLVMRYPALYRVLPWVSHQVCDKNSTLFWRRSRRWYLFDFLIGNSETAMISSDGDHIPTEVETRIQSRRLRAVVTLRLVPLASSAPVPLASASRERNREPLEEAFDNGMHRFRWGKFCGVP